MPDASINDTNVVADVDVHDGDLVVIDGPGQWMEFEDKQTKEIRKRLKIPLICVDGTGKDITLNETSRKYLIGGYGKVTEEWQGKKALISIVQKDVFGQIKKVIYLNPVRG